LIQIGGAAARLGSFSGFLIQLGAPTLLTGGKAWPPTTKFLRLRLEISRSARPSRPPAASAASFSVLEDDVGMLTLSSGAREGLNGDKTVREDDVRVLTLSSRHQEGRNGGKTVREDDVGLLTLSSYCVIE
jgi:hypothetical protein